MKKNSALSKVHLIWLIPLIVLFSPILIPIVIYTYFDDKKNIRKARIFWTNNKNMLYFLYSYKNGWKEIVENNIIPALPINTKTINIYRDSDKNFRILNTILYNISDHDYSHRIPFIVKLEIDNPVVYSLHDDYVSKKHQYAKKNLDFQNEIQLLFNEKLNIA